MNQLIGENASKTGAAKAIATLVIVAALVLGALISARHLSAHFSSSEAYSYQIERLDAKKETVMQLTVASATVSAAISMIPGDTCTPIAEQLAGISKDFTVVLAAILLEKYLLTTLGLVLFGGIVPACLVGIALSILLPRGSRASAFILSGALRILVAGTVVWASVPASVLLTDRIEETHGPSISAAIASADEAALVSEELGKGDAMEEVGFVERLVALVTNPGNTVSTAAERIGELALWAKTVLGDFVEGLAVMAVTTCVIPVLTPLGVLWLVRMLLAPGLAHVQSDGTALRRRPCPADEITVR